MILGYCKRRLKRVVHLAITHDRCMKDVPLQYLRLDHGMVGLLNCQNSILRVSDDLVFSPTHPCLFLFYSNAPSDPIKVLNIIKEC